MLWVVDYRPELHLVIIYIGYQSAINSLQQDIESTSKLDYEGANTPMGPNGSRSKLIYHDDTVYEIGLALGSFDRSQTQSIRLRYFVFSSGEKRTTI